ncbi:MAG: excinuclease ABC subunit UvrC [Candidatus Eisenbacteria bacterium]|nr:excinuclease ABC subunit UvrC [Candidatus Eisenbacteria bacterium]
MTSELRRKLGSIPRRPGVYLMKDRTGRIIYVGKAKRLDLRLRSHFSGASDHPKQIAMIHKTVDLDVIATDTEVDALILEMTLIKEKRPVYNINLKDDKRFPFVKVTMQEEFPQIVLTRRVKADGARYFGPYTDVGALRQSLRNLRTIFPLRSCPGDRPGRGPGRRECLDYYIHRCLAPCIKPELAAEYRAAAEAFCLFLSGGAEAVIARLKADMDSHAGRLEFEAATRRRDQIRLIERMQRRQRMVDVQQRDTDLMAFTRSGDLAFGVVLQIRDGRVIGKERRTLKGVAHTEDAEVMAAFLLQHYDRAELLPAQVAVSTKPIDESLIRDWMTRRAGHHVTLMVPKKGPLAHLVRLALSNARLDMEGAQGIRTGKELPAGLYELQILLDLEAPPVRIECFDISNIQGTHPVASLVMMIAGRLSRADYRRYRMATPGPDDFAMMREVVGRRARRVVLGEFESPDLILIDGGVGQVNAAREALASEGLGHLPVIGLAKRQEEIIVPGQSTPIRLPRNHEALKLLIQLRDEAHRFAVTYHRSRRGKAALRSRLEGIPGIGAERRLALLSHFGSVDAMRVATAADLARVPGMGPATVRRLLEALESGGDGVAA